jgi:hypothetical protein
LRDLLLLLVFVVVLYELRRMTQSGPAPRLPLAYKLIQERCDKVLLRSVSYVEELLGPPSSRECREPECESYEAMQTAQPGIIPRGDMWWSKWNDPNDTGKWVAVYFEGHTAYHVVKKGF